jgi:hypothetical protein
MTDRWGLAFVVTVTVVGILLAGLAFWDIATQQGRVDGFRRNCAEAGGHVYSPEIVLCLDQAGGVMEVYP